MNLAHTDDTQLGRVRRLRAEALGGLDAPPTCCSWATSSPTSSAGCGRSANGSRLAALDSMNLWIETTRDSLVAAIGEVDCLLLQRRRDPDADRGAEPGPRRAGVMEHGPADRGRQARRVRGGPVHPRGLLRAPGLPARGRPRPDRRRRQLRRRLPRLPRHAGHRAARATQTLRQAMAYGTVLASFNVEEFGTERVARLTEDEVSERYDALRAMTHFELPCLTRDPVRARIATSRAPRAARPTPTGCRSAPSSGAARLAGVSSRVGAVGQPLLTAHRDRPAAQLAHRRREPPLRDAEPEAGGGDADARRPPRRASGCRAR